MYAVQTVHHFCLHISPRTQYIFLPPTMSIRLLPPQGLLPEQRLVCNYIIYKARRTRHNILGVVARCLEAVLDPWELGTIESCEDTEENTMPRVGRPASRNAEKSRATSWTPGIGPFSLVFGFNFQKQNRCIRLYFSNPT